MNNTISTDCFNLMPGLVIDYVGQPAVVTNVIRDVQTEVITFSVNTPDGDVTLHRSWGRGDTVTIIGLCPNLDVDSIDLFNS